MSIEELYDVFKNSSGVSTDSREVQKNCIYFALKGEHFDGNNYVKQALENGSLFAVSEDPLYEEFPNVWVVNNSLEVLQKLASFHRSRWGGKILAITGSNGKTTTKELVAAVLSRHYKVLATKGNLNNHIGVPLTLLSINDESFAIVEMGANHQGEIKLLCEISKPDYGLITNIGKAHLEGFGGVEGVKKGKGELFDYLALNDGYAFVNTDDKILSLMASERNLKVIAYNRKINEEIHVIPDSVSPEIVCNFNYNQNSFQFSSPLYGDYNLLNILAAISVGVHFGIDPVDIPSAIESYSPGSNRSQVIEGENNTLILDAYNANPSSMLLALNDFKERNSEGGKLAILGDMLELGSGAAAEHTKVLEYLREHQLHAILVGEVFSSLSADFEYKFKFFKHIDDCIEYLGTHPLNNYLVLLKGSRKIMLEKLTKYLI